MLPAYAGKQMERELDALDAALGTPKRPVLGIVGGAKVSTKLELLQNLITKLDKLAIGGGMANTFLYAQGLEIGGSLAERTWPTPRARSSAAAKGRMRTAAAGRRRRRQGVEADRRRSAYAGSTRSTRTSKILDAGAKTVRHLREAMKHSNTLIWNGPLGVFEVPPFDQGTVIAAQDAAELAKAGKLIAVAGGGDTVAALNHAGVAGDITFVSTAGGAFLEWMEGKPLPGVEALRVNPPPDVPLNFPMPLPDVAFFRTRAKPPPSIAG